MNTSSNNGNISNNTSPTTNASAGSGFGHRVKGAYEFVHGAGENVRGTMMGAVDTIAKDGTKNDDIASKGRLEMQKGLANMKGPSAQAAGPVDSVPQTLHSSPPQGHGLGENQYHTDTRPQDFESGGMNTNPVSGHQSHIPATGMAGATGGGVNDQHAPAATDVAHPMHHRDDAIPGLPPNQLHEIQDSANTGYQPPQHPYNGGHGTAPLSNTMESQGPGFANDTQKYPPPPTHPDNMNQATRY